MTPGMKLLIYGSDRECRDAAACFDHLGCDVECVFADSWENLRSILKTFTPSLMVVVTPGAAGMEGVYLTRKYSPETPVFWFSDDKDFGLQSHRLECAYFSQTPITPPKLESAFRRCAHVGVRFR